MKKATLKSEKYRDLVNDIKRAERVIAYGSESIMWGEFLTRMEDISGVSPLDIDAKAGVDYDALEVPHDEASWWRAAYAYLEAHPHADRDDVLDAGDNWDVTTKTPASGVSTGEQIDTI